MTMIPILSAQGMREAETATIERWGVPARVLMESAGRAAADAVADVLGDGVDGARIVVVCGAGNNGGDGLVVARVLHARGASVTAVADEGGSDDRTANLDLARRLAAASPETFRLVADTDDVSRRPSAAVVDAILGTGTTGTLRADAARAAAWIAAQDCPIVALDVPTGIDATTGQAAEGAVRADVTVSFGALKAGLVLGAGPAHAGRVVVAEIGVPAVEIEAAASAHRPTDAWVRVTLPRRAADANKYSAGHAVVVAGSRPYSGAAVLASTAALRAGAGAVVCCAPASIQATIDAHSAEVMVEACPETSAGTLTLAAIDAITERTARADAVLVGCGLGRTPETARLVRTLVRRLRMPVVLDADGLRAFAGHDTQFAERDRAAPLVLTPHLGELRALVGDDRYDPADRVAAVRELAARWQAVVLLKGMPSVVGCPDGRVVVGPPGETALATAGSGDTLAGTIVGLLAQGLSAPDAAVCALCLGSEAARVAGGTPGVVASDLVAALPAALARFNASPLPI